ncbi:hypothetical protein N8Z37_05120 [Octadecabacter sp.]|nr:hypothetical protein [Octadecabacter sp.]
MLKHFFLIARLYFVFLFFGLSSLPQHVGAETCIDVQDTSGIPTPVYIDSDGSLYMLEPAFEDYSYMLYDACFAWDIPLESGCSIYPMMGAINRNALATTCNGNKIIIYDRRLSPNLGYIGAQAVIAHELGHHICGHLGASLISNHQSELEADRFAGATLRLMGFSRESAGRYANILSDHATPTHPSRLERLAALRAGWDNPYRDNVCQNFAGN